MSSLTIILKSQDSSPDFSQSSCEDTTTKLDPRHGQVRYPLRIITLETLTLIEVSPNPIYWSDSLTDLSAIRPWLRNLTVRKTVPAVDLPKQGCKYRAAPGLFFLNSRRALQWGSPHTIYQDSVMFTGGSDCSYIWSRSPEFLTVGSLASQVTCNNYPSSIVVWTPTLGWNNVMLLSDLDWLCKILMIG